MSVNILLLPSWYPTKNNPLSGSFTKEQSLLISEEQDVKYYVSIIELYSLSPRQPISSLKNIYNHFKFKISEKVITSSYLEYRQSSYSWTKKIYNGNLSHIIDLHIKYLTKLLEDGIKIDIIHAHVSYPAGYISYILSQKFDIPYVITEHMSPFPFSSYMNNNKPIKEIKLALNNSKEVIAVSESLKKDIMKFGFKKPIVIANFIDENRYQLINKINRKNEKFIFLTVGSMTHQKGIDILLESISLIKDKIINIEFRIIGDGLELYNYKQLAKKLKIAHLVNFLGKKNREDVLVEFENCNAFVLPSRHESFGVVYIEALACGKPIIATICGGPESIVININGLLVQKDNSTLFSNAILKMYTSYNKYDGKRIRDDFLEKFSKRINTKKYMEMYQKVVKCVE